MEGELIIFLNFCIGWCYEINISLLEFICKCFFFGYLDFVIIYIKYIFNEWVVELKVIKLYINSYRECYIFYEELVN